MRRKMLGLGIVLASCLFALGAGAASAAQGAPTFISFTTTTDRVDRDALENGTARVPVSWRTANRTPGANLVFEQMLPDGSAVNVELPRDNPWVASSGDGIAAPVLPGADAAEIVLRVRLFDLTTNEVYDERSLVIPIGPGTGSAPRITRFTAGVAQVSRVALQAQTARIPVTWESLNRPNTATLVFEQVHPDGTAVNIEFPRANPWVNPSGDGAVRPVLPNASDAPQVKLQIRMVDLVTGVVYDTRYTYLNIVGDEPSAAIASFRTGATSVRLSELADGSARIPLTWEAVNRPDGSNLVFEQVLSNGTVVNVELPRNFVLVSSVGAGIAAPRLPGGSADQIRLQVRLIDLTTGHEYSRASLSLPISNTGDPPRIARFTAGVMGLHTGNFGTAAGRVPVSWSVLNRPDGSNLVFEQRLPGGQVVNVELPRSNPWVASEGVGVMNPVYPGPDVQSVTFQLRLVDITTHTTITLAEITLPVVDDSGTPGDADPADVVEVSGAACYEAPFAADQGLAVGALARADTGLAAHEDPYGATPHDGFLGEEVEIIEGPRCFYYPTPTHSLVHVRMWKVRGTQRTITGWVREYTFTQTETYYHLRLPDETSGEVEVVSFSADKDTVGAGETITFTWETRNAHHVMLRAALTHNHASDIMENDLPPSGSFTMTMPAYIGGGATGTFYLQVFASPDWPHQITDSLEITLSCDNQFFFGQGADCVVEPAASAEAAYQTFEYGAMVWYGATNSIYMLLNGGTGARFVDTWDGTSAITWDETPPDGLMLPARGFGWLWTQNAGVRDAAGWATAPEQGYTIQMQRGVVANNTPEQYVLYFTTPDGRTIRYVESGDGSAWAIVP
ncbi:MAG: hypothetical protein JXB47_12120 [Anaerolineae bacterium]|nr:hypothetical protein [Anaerolineae bacterium]